MPYRDRIGSRPSKRHVENIVGCLLVGSILFCAAALKIGSVRGSASVQGDSLVAELRLAGSDIRIACPRLGGRCESEPKTDLRWRFEPNGLSGLPRRPTILAFGPEGVEAPAQPISFVVAEGGSVRAASPGSFRTWLEDRLFGGRAPPARSHEGIARVCGPSSAAPPGSPYASLDARQGEAESADTPHLQMHE